MVTGLEPVTHFALRRRWGASYRASSSSIQSGEHLKASEQSSEAFLYRGWIEPVTHFALQRRWGASYRASSISSPVGGAY